MKKNYVFKFKLSEEMAKKLSYVSKSEGMTVQNMLSQLLRQKVQYFERVKGSVSKKELDTSDITVYEIEESN